VLKLEMLLQTASSGSFSLMC